MRMRLRASSRAEVAETAGAAPRPRPGDAPAWVVPAAVPPAPGEDAEGRSKAKFHDGVPVCVVGGGVCPGPTVIWSGVVGSVGADAGGGRSRPSSDHRAE